MRKHIIAGNWKMNNNLDQTEEFIERLKEKLQSLNLENKRVLIAPSFVNLRSAIKKSEGTKIEIVAQNVHQEKEGAYTGEVSADMLTNIGINTVIIGHSERRLYFGETEELLHKKVKTALSLKMEVIYCFGESLSERENNKHFEVIGQQIERVLFSLSSEEIKNIVLAYEPVWAIGTGKTASPEQAEEVHAFVRKLINKQYGNKISENISILYGGSVKPNNAKDIFSKPNVDGGLIGGASLKAKDFSEIIKAIK